MNNHIIKLAIQANLIAEEYNGFDRTSLTPAEIRFAESIVDSCCYLLECDRDWISAIPLIREKFGISHNEPQYRPRQPSHTTII